MDKYRVGDSGITIETERPRRSTWDLRCVLIWLLVLASMFLSVLAGAYIVRLLS